MVLTNILEDLRETSYCQPKVNWPALSTFCAQMLPSLRSWHKRCLGSVEQEMEEGQCPQRLLQGHGHCDKLLFLVLLGRIAKIAIISTNALFTSRDWN